MKQNAEFPRVLVVSNNCFSKTNSNGRTLGNFFSGWPKERLAQFYIQNEWPDFEVCENYFRVTDGQAVKALLGKHGGGAVTAASVPAVADLATATPAKKRSRNALTMMARNVVWNLGAWKKSGFDAWVADFAPEAVLLQAGDNSFMFALARKTASRYGVPLFIYNSEGYYFKDFDYFRAKGLAHWCYPLFRWGFCREFRRTQRQTAYNVYLCDGLREAYAKEFDTPAVTLYTASNLTPCEKTEESTGFTVSYLGNMGVGRHEGLVAIANALQRISPDYYLDVYGKIPNDAVQTAFDGCRGIRYKGFLSYEQVTQVMQDSDLLVHTESFSDFYKEDLKFAFSTKIADSLACGRCFLLYAPENVESYRYLRRNELAYTADSPEALTDVLRLLTQDVTARHRYLANAQKAVQERHSMQKNRQMFADIIKMAGAIDEGVTN